MSSALDFRTRDQPKVFQPPSANSATHQGYRWLEGRSAQLVLDLAPGGRRTRRLPDEPCSFSRAGAAASPAPRASAAPSSAPTAAIWTPWMRSPAPTRSTLPFESRTRAWRSLALPRDADQRHVAARETRGARRRPHRRAAAAPAARSPRAAAAATGPASPSARRGCRDHPHRLRRRCGDDACRLRRRRGAVPAPAALAGPATTRTGGAASTRAARSGAGLRAAVAGRSIRSPSGRAGGRRRRRGSPLPPLGRARRRRPGRRTPAAGSGRSAVAAGGRGVAGAGRCAGRRSGTGPSAASRMAAASGRGAAAAASSRRSCARARGGQLGQPQLLRPLPPLLDEGERQVARRQRHDRRRRQRGGRPRQRRRGAHDPERRRGARRELGRLGPGGGSRGRPDGRRRRRRRRKQRQRKRRRSGQRGGERRPAPAGRRRGHPCRGRAEAGLRVARDFDVRNMRRTSSRKSGSRIILLLMPAPIFCRVFACAGNHSRKSRADPARVCPRRDFWLAAGGVARQILAALRAPDVLACA